MSEAKNAEAELAKVIWLAGFETANDDDLAAFGEVWKRNIAREHKHRDVMVLRAFATARALLSAGYAKRSETLEEAAKVADAEHARYDEVHQSNLEYLAREGRRHSDALSRTETGVRTASTIAAAIRSLKGQQ